MISVVNNHGMPFLFLRSFIDVVNKPSLGRFQLGTNSLRDEPIWDSDGRPALPTTLSVRVAPINRHIVGEECAKLNIETISKVVQIPSPILLSSEDRLLTAGALLSWRNITAVIITRQKEIVGTIYGYQLLLILAQVAKDSIYKKLFQSIRDAVTILTPERIPTVRIEDESGKALEQIVSKRFGDVLVVNGQDRPIGLLSLRELLQSCQQRFRRVGIRVDSVASPIKTVSDHMSFKDLIFFMFRNRIRRIVVKRSDGYYHTNERALLKHFFSLGGLQFLRDNAGAALNSPITDFVKESAMLMDNAKSSEDVAETWNRVIATGQDCVTAGGNKIATPWDLVVKPYLMGKLRL